MEIVIQQFRSALSGFNRRDVQQYIEQTNAAHKREVAELKARLEESESRRTELEQDLSGLENERGSAVAEEARVREHLETATKTLAKLRGEQTETEAKLAVARKELERLQAQVAELEPLAASYKQLKDRVATVELDAHRKAQGIINEAQEEADGIRADTTQWLQGVMTQYGTVRSGLDALLTQTKALCAAAEQTAALEEQASLLKQRGGLE